MATYRIITTNGSLQHHGVKGMKWGVRRQRKPSKRRIRQDKYDKAKSELFSRLSNEYMGIAKTLPNNPASKIEDDFYRKHPNADADDLGDYLVNHPKLSKQYENSYANYQKLIDQKYKKQKSRMYEIGRQQHFLGSNNKFDAAAGSIISGLTVSPVAASIANKILKRTGVKEWKRAAITLGTYAATTAGIGAANAISGHKNRKAIMAEYGYYYPKKKKK